MDRVGHHIIRVFTGSFFFNATMLWLYIIGGIFQLVLIQGYQETDSCVCLQTVMEGLFNPLAIVTSKTKPQRIFIAEQNGMVTELENKPSDGQRIKPYLNLREKIYISREHMDERGLLDMALHPDFDINGRVFFFYIGFSVGQGVAHISEFREHDGSVDIGTETILISIDYPDHGTNGGQILFGKDGYLYIFVGDGDVNNRSQAQNGSSLLGKVLRVDVDKKSEGKKYSSPQDNPFWSMQKTSWEQEIYSIGFRDPWSCSMDRGDSSGNGMGRIFCGEIGDDAFDEINVIYKGGNYGWDIREGIECRRNDSGCSQRDHEIPPLFVHRHEESAAMTALIGGIIYRGSMFPEIRGQYLYGEVFSGNLSRLTENADGVWVSSPLPFCNSSRCLNGATGKPYMLSFGETSEGECYVLMTSSFSIDVKAGAVYKLVPPDTVLRATSFQIPVQSLHLYQIICVIVAGLITLQVII